MKRNENFWSYRLHKNGTPKVLRTDGRTDRRTDRRRHGRPDGRSGPTTRPAFAKATQVKMLNHDTRIIIKLEEDIIVLNNVTQFHKTLIKTI